MEPSDLLNSDPRSAADTLACASEGQSDWLNAFAEQLDRHLSRQALVRTLGIWGLNQSQAAVLFGVSRQALSKWLEHGVPSERAGVVADLAAATDLLVHYLKRDRIAAVVRRPVAQLRGQSLLDLVASGQTVQLVQVCREMFDFSRAQH